MYTIYNNNNTITTTTTIKQKYYNTKINKERHNGVRLIIIIS